MVRALKYKTKKKDADRNNHLENIVGNLLISEQQVMKLKSYLVEALSYVPYGSTDDDAAEAITKDESTFPFIHDGKLYKIHINVEKVKNESMV